MGKRKKKSNVLLGEKIKCVLCEAISHTYVKRMHMSLKNPRVLAVLLSSHVLFGDIDLEFAKIKFETCVNVYKMICDVHFIDAAHKLVMKLIAVGVPFSSFGNGSASFGMTVVVDQNDIPKQFLDQLNEVVKQFDKDFSITNEDVTKFVNKYVWRYLYRQRSNNSWDAISQLLPGIKRKIVEEPRPERRTHVGKAMNLSTLFPSLSSKPTTWEARREEILLGEAVKNVPNSNGTKYEGGFKSASYGNTVLRLPGPSRTSSTKMEPHSDSANSMPISAFDLIRPLPRLATTDPELLQRSVTLHVEDILKLFKFCPQCGQKLEANGSVQLIVNKALAVVHYVCERCSQAGPVIKSWESWSGFQ